MKKNILLSFLLILFFTQCKSLPIQRVKQSMTKSFSMDLLVPDIFYKSRDLMFNTFSNNIMDNDSIIILEYYTDGLGQYSCTIYESKDKLVRKYFLVTSIKEGIVIADSLVSTDLKDNILIMVLNSQLEKIKMEGENSTLTPSARLIISILRKDDKKRRFNLETLNTFRFATKSYN